VIPVDQVVSIPQARGHVVETPLVLKPGARWYDLWFSPGSGSFKEPMGEDVQGEFVKPVVSLFSPRETPTVAHFAAQLQGVRCLVVFQDANALSRIVGSLEYPLSFKHESDTGTSLTSKSGSTFTFSGEQPEKSYFYMAIQMPTGDSAPGWCCGRAGSNQVLAERVEVAGVNLKVVNHTRGARPFVNVIDTAGNTVEFALQYTSDTAFVVSFNYVFTGSIIYL
jgi:hypothetical protein